MKTAMPDVLFEITSRDALRRWFESNCRTARECWIVLSMRPVPDTVLYLDAVEEALCFGWIDGTVKTLADGRLIRRFSPRSARSQWSELNRERARRLERLGLMTDEGRKCLPAEDEYVIDPDIYAALRADERVWMNFCSFPALYRRVRTNTVAIKKKDPELFARRLAKLVENTAAGLMYGDWDDDGRLSDY